LAIERQERRINNVNSVSPEDSKGWMDDDVCLCRSLPRRDCTSSETRVPPPLHFPAIFPADAAGGCTYLYRILDNPYRQFVELFYATDEFIAQRLLQFHQTRTARHRLRELRDIRSPYSRLADENRKEKLAWISTRIDAGKGIISVVCK